MNRVNLFVIWCSRWRQFKKKVEEYVEDWKRYNMHLKVCWEQKYKMLITGDYNINYYDIFYALDSFTGIT